MRIFKPTYSKSLPEDAKTFICKQGSDKGKMFAKFKDSKGHTSQARLTKSGDKILLETENWHIEFEDTFGIRRRLKAYTNQQASCDLAKTIQELLDCKYRNQQPDENLCKKFEVLPATVKDALIQFRLLDGQRASIAKPLTEHITDFEDYLQKKERTRFYIYETVRMLTKTFEDCGFKVWSDISAVKLKDYLDGKRDNGKGISKRRYNGLLKAVKFFCKWMVKTQKASNSPVEYLDGLDNPQTDQRHARRALDLNDFRRFLEAALNSKETIYGLTGYERNLLYRFAAETGLRSIDIRRLKVQDIDFDERKILIKAGKTKNKSNAFVYLKPATAAELKQYCKNKLPAAPVIYVTDKTSKMVQFDLAKTRIVDNEGKEILAAVPYANEHKEYFDFHSLRHMTASLLGMNPDTPESVRQRAMRHKSPEMTRHYTHTFEDLQREAIEALPDLTQPSRESQAMVKTGTDDRNVTGEFLSDSCFDGATIRSNTQTSGIKNLDITEKTQYCENNQGVVRTVDPKVEGSSPFGLVV